MGVGASRRKTVAAGKEVGLLAATARRGTVLVRVSVCLSCYDVDGHLKMLSANRGELARGASDFCSDNGRKSKARSMAQAAGRS